MENLSKEKIIEKLSAAKIAEDFFGKDFNKVGSLFRLCAKTINADQNPDLQEYYRKLIEFHEEAKTKNEKNRYGKINYIDPFEIKFQKKIYKITEFLGDGDTSSIYGTEDGYILKVALTKDYNKYLINENKILEKICSDNTSNYLKYFPKFIKSFVLDNKQINVFERISNHITLNELITSAQNTNPEIQYDFRDMAWIFKRILEAIGYIHSLGINHGSIIPEHVLINPKTHGIKLIDWCWAVSNDKLKAITKHRKNIYPPEVFTKLNLTNQSDIYMAAKCAICILGGNLDNNELPMCTPIKIKNFLASCLIQNPARRPENAWDVHEKFCDVLKELVGPPQYKNLQLADNISYT